MKEYKETPLHCLEALADDLNVKEIYVKDESYRFGLNAFKGLGVSFAINKILKKNHKSSYTFVSCTDGNHGKALAWMANLLGYKAIVFMPKGSEQRRIKAIEDYHAEVIVTEMNYDDTVRYAADYAKANNYYLIQDTALPGYTEVANDIILGYSTMIREALEQIPQIPTHIFLQAGVGSMAGGVIWYISQKSDGAFPFIGIIESSNVPCIYESVAKDKLISIGGEPSTIMAGLNCGEPNFSIFPLLKARCNCFIKCKDETTIRGMMRAKNPMANDCSFNAGESGAVGLGFIEKVMTDPDYVSLKKNLKLDANSIVLVFNTEGETLV
jgi:diaminopropionate ammonia-lyase